MIKDEKLKNNRPIVLVSDIEYASGSVVSRTLLENTGGTVTLFAFDKGQSLSKHSAPYDAMVQVVDGMLELEIGPATVPLKTGELIVMPAEVPHALKALQSTKMILIMMKP